MYIELTSITINYCNMADQKLTEATVREVAIIDFTFSFSV